MSKTTEAPTLTGGQPWFSDSTNKLRVEVRRLRGEVTANEAAAAGVIGIDQPDIDKATAALSNIRARLEVIRAALARRKHELYTSLLTDARINRDQTEATWKKECKAWANARDNWKQSVKCEHSKAGATIILLHGQTVPKNIRAIEKTYRTAHEAYGAASSLLARIDPALLSPTAAYPVDGHIRTEADCHREAGELCADLLA